MQRRVLKGKIISVKEARSRIKDRGEDEAATEAKRAEKRQKRAQKQSDDTTATASARSRQNQHQFEQIIKFLDRNGYIRSIGVEVVDLRC
jgi:hypothetical protein